MLCENKTTKPIIIDQKKTHTLHFDTEIHGTLHVHNKPIYSAKGMCVYAGT